MAEIAFDVVVLAGGRGSRLGGVSKADLVVGGVRLLDRVLASADGARTMVVVGAVEVPPGVLLTREDPPGTGPAAGLVAGLAAVADPAPWTLVLACDLPDAADAVAQVLAAAAGADAAVQGVCAAGRGGDPEWLLAAYRSDALRRAASDYGDPRDRSVRGLVRRLNLAVVTGGATEDLDTWADYARWNAHLRGRKRMTQPEDRSGWQPFVAAACAAVDVDPALVAVDAVLDLTREIAHAGARPMAPVTAYIWGLAAGRPGAEDPDYLRRVVEDAVSAAPLPQDA